MKTESHSVFYYTKLDMNHIQFSVRTLIFIRNRGKVLLICKEYPTKPGEVIWNGVGGHVESGEDIIASANREIFEETGLLVKEIWLSAIISLREHEKQDVILLVFNAKDVIGTMRSSTEGSICWFDENELRNIHTFDDLVYLLQITSSVEKNQAPLIIHFEYLDGKKNIRLIRNYRLEK